MSPKNFDDLKCVWMSSGIIDYRLCDMRFNCDNCEFDMVMKNRQPHKIQPVCNSNNYLTFLRAQIECLHSSEIITVLRNNISLRRIYKNSYMLGISQFAWLLLGDEAHFQMDKGFVKSGDILFFIFSDWGRISVTAPFDTFIVSTFLPQSGNAASSGSWLGLIEADEHAIEENISTNEAYKSSALTTYHTMVRECELNHAFTTLNDGGKPVSSVPQMVGRTYFKKMFKNIMNP